MELEDPTNIDIPPRTSSYKSSENSNIDDKYQQPRSSKLASVSTNSKEPGRNSLKDFYSPPSTIFDNPFHSFSNRTSRSSTVTDRSGGGVKELIGVFCTIILTK